MADRVGYYYGARPTSNTTDSPNASGLSAFGQVGTSLPTTRRLKKIVDGALLPSAFVIATLAAGTTDAGVSNTQHAGAGAVESGKENKQGKVRKTASSASKKRNATKQRKRPVDSESDGFARSVHSVRAKSGLTWDEIASLIGVSRRTLHNWANGARLSSANTVRWNKLAELIDRYDRGNANATRSSLLARRLNSRSPYEEIQRLLADKPSVSNDFSNPSARVSVTEGKPVPGGRLVSYENFG